MKIRTRLVLACSVQLGFLLALLAWQQVAEQAHLDLTTALLPTDSAAEHAARWLAIAPPAAGLATGAMSDGGRGRDALNSGLPDPLRPSAMQGLNEPRVESARQTLAHAQTWVQALAFGLMGLCVWLAVSLDRAVRQPLRQLRQWAEQMRAGDLDSRSRLSGPTEFAEVSDAIDRMAGTVADSMQQLRAEVQRREAAEAALRQLAYHDALTGLPTQRLLRDRLEMAMARARRQSRGLTVMFVDLDDFKPVNDLHGHDVGDRVLQAVAKRLMEAVRECDTIARVGGDEFVVLLPELDDATAAQALRRKLQLSLARPLRVEGGAEVLRSGASVGIAQFPQDGTDADQLLRQADQDMYRNKSMRKLLDRLDRGSTPDGMPPLDAP